MVREYIGARYVPKFMGTYDATQIYEALCVVDNGLGTSYISKVPTPAGTPLTDTDYWAIYGASSGAIVNLQNQIDDMNDGNVSGSLQNQVDTVVSDVSTLQSEVAEMQANKILFIGDSFNTIYAGEGWDVSMINLLGLDPADYFQINIAGAGFTTSPSWTDALYNRLSLITDKDQYKAIIIGSGGNDKAATLATTITAMNTFKTLANANFPNAEIYVGFLGWTGLPADHSGFRNGLLNYISACDSVGFKYLHNVEYVLHWKPYLRDNTGITPGDYLHPTSAGLVALAEKMVQAYKSGTCNVRYSALVTLSPDGTNCTNIAGASISASLDNGVTTLVMTPQSFTIAVAIALRTGKAIGTFACDCFDPASLLVNDFASDLNDNSVIPFVLGFSNGALSIAPIANIGAGHGIQSQQLNMTFPTTSC